MRINKTKAKLRAGETVLGVGIPFSSPELVELIGAIGFDYVTFDLEHEPYSEQSLTNSIRAAEAYDVTPIARVANDPDLILRLLDAGAQGVHIPGINTAAEAQRVVSAARFHPFGKRTFYSTGRGGHYGIGVSEETFVEIVNSETLVILQVEEVEGMKNLDQILEVRAVDAIQFGPKDLRQSMGFPPYDVVWQDVESGLKKVNSAGLWSSMVGWIGSDTNSDKMTRYGQLGVRMITGQAREFIIHGADAFRALASNAIGSR